MRVRKKCASLYSQCCNNKYEVPVLGKYPPLKSLNGSPFNQEPEQEEQEQEQERNAGKGSTIIVFSIHASSLDTCIAIPNPLQCSKLVCAS